MIGPLLLFGVALNRRRGQVTERYTMDDGIRVEQGAEDGTA